MQKFIRTDSLSHLSDTSPFLIRCHWHPGKYCHWPAIGKGL